MQALRCRMQWYFQGDCQLRMEILSSGYMLRVRSIRCDLEFSNDAKVSVFEVLLHLRSCKGAGRKIQR